MSSNASRPRPTTIQLAPTVVLDRTSAHTDDAQDEALFIGFARAIGLGTLIGIPAFMAIIALVMRVGAPDVDLWTAFPVILWTAIWTGVFLGGTITVGLWARKNMH